MTRPQLRRIPLCEVLPIGKTSGVMATMSTGQWDRLLADLYGAGCILLELDHRERPIRAYQKAGADVPAERGN